MNKSKVFIVTLMLMAFSISLFAGSLQDSTKAAPSATKEMKAKPAGKAMKGAPTMDMPAKAKKAMKKSMKGKKSSAVESMKPSEKAVPAQMDSTKKHE